MATRIKFDEKAGLRIEVGLNRPLRRGREFFAALALMVDRDAMLAFRRQGERGGHPRWKRFSENTLRTPAGTKKIRYGTDLRPLDPEALRQLRARWIRTKGFGATGEMRKGVRRYSSTSKLLQASGGFRNSFKIRMIRRNRMLYSTNHELAEKIMSHGPRNVLFITSRDEIRYLNQFRTFFLRGIRF